MVHMPYASLDRAMNSVVKSMVRSQFCARAKTQSDQYRSLITSVRLSVRPSAMTFRLLMMIAVCSSAPMKTCFVALIIL